MQITRRYFLGLSAFTLCAGVLGLPRIALASALTVDEHVDMAPDGPTLVEDPARHGRMLVFELAEEFLHRGAADLELGAAAGELPEGSVDADEGHRFRILRPDPEPKVIVHGRRLEKRT